MSNTFCLIARYTDTSGNNMIFFLALTRVAFASFWSALQTNDICRPLHSPVLQAGMSDESHLAPHPGNYTD